MKHSKTWREILAFYRYLKPSLWAMRLPLVGHRLARWFIKEDSDAKL